MLLSPSHAVVGTRDPERTAHLLGVFGMEIQSRGVLGADLAASLYGLDGPSSEIMLGVPGAQTGGLCLVETPHGAEAAGHYDPRPIAVDFYTRDIKRSAELARAEGLHLGELVDYALGPMRLKEFEAEDDDGLRLVFIEIENRRPSVLDREPDRLHSEIHSMVYAVGDAEVSLGFWRDVAGLDVLVDAPITGPVISQLMGLPRPNVPVRFTLLCDAEAAPARFEVLQFTDEIGTPVATRPLRAGLDAAVFTVQNLDAARQHLSGDKVPIFGDEVAFDPAGPRRIRRAVAGLAPDGVRFELWQP